MSLGVGAANADGNDESINADIAPLTLVGVAESSKQYMVSRIELPCYIPSERYGPGWPNFILSN